MNKKFKLIISSLVLFLLTPSFANAYIGPGIALGTIVLTISILLILILAIIAILYYPIKKMIKKSKLKKLKNDK
tara:strand:- start:506 stop:727 length:222 start_codon:yes stop_codon:yes gene_type:complete